MINIGFFLRINIGNILVRIHIGNICIFRGVGPRKCVQKQHVADNKNTYWNIPVKCPGTPDTSILCRSKFEGIHPQTAQSLSKSMPEQPFWPLWHPRGTRKMTEHTQERRKGVTQVLQRTRIRDPGGSTKVQPAPKASQNGDHKAAKIRDAAKR